MISRRSCLAGKPHILAHFSVHALVGLLCMWIPQSLSAQLLERALVIKNAQVHTGSGRRLERATIVVKGGRIIDIAADPDLPLLKQVIDAEGKVVTPGLVDVWSAHGMGATRSVGAAMRAEDAFDHYETAAHVEALRGGVTTVYLGRRGGLGIRGTGAVVRLEPLGGGAFGSVLASAAALDIDFGDASTRPLTRVGILAGVRASFEGAKAYRQSLEKYDEDLAKYVESVEKRAAKKDPKKPKGGKGQKPAAAAQAEAAAKKKDEKSPPEIKKPKRPRRREDYERILEVLDRELPVRIHAERSADIMNALELARDYDLDLTLEGATEAHLLADSIPQEIAIITSPQKLLGESARKSSSLRYHDGNAASLASAGLETFLGTSNASTSATRLLTLLSALEQPELEESQRLKQLTADAARLLGVEKSVGHLRRGMLADLVIWSDSPFSPQARVEKTFVGGKLAYEAQGDAR